MLVGQLRGFASEHRGYTETNLDGIDNPSKWPPSREKPPPLLPTLLDAMLIGVELVGGEVVGRNLGENNVAKVCGRG